MSEETVVLLKIKILILLVLLSLLSVFSLHLEMRIVGYILFILSFFSLLFFEENERKERIKGEKSLSKLKHLYNDLDEQAKLIVQTDLKLSKAEEDLNKRIGGLYVLQDIGRMISNTKNFFEPSTQKFNLEYSINKVSETITSALVERLEFEKSALFLADKKTYKIIYCSGEGYNRQEQEKMADEKTLTLFLEKKEIKEAFTKRTPVLVKKISSFPSKSEKEINSFFTVSSFAIVPIIVQEDIIGSIFVGNSLYYNEIDEQDLEFLSILAEQTAVAIGNIYLYQETINALDANPLTKLPGNISINQRLEKCFQHPVPFAICYADIDEFKAFNDRYGFEAGDKAIQQTAALLREALENIGNPTDFIGHIGGDDFILVTTPDKVKSLCQQIIKNFDQQIPSLYSSQDRKNGYIISKTRQDEIKKFPLMTISIAVISNLYKKINHIVQISELSAELKEYAKSLKGSVYVQDKRNGEGYKVKS